MSEIINEQISVNFFSNHLKGTALPSSVYWRGRDYHITQVGLHHVFREGRVLIHVFSVTDGNNYFKLTFNSETLFWKLLEIDSDC